MGTSKLRAVVVIGWVFFGISFLAFGCGNPEAPQITKVRLSYWDTLTSEGSWVSIEDGEVALQSPVRIQGNITDNTAVVNPRINWVGRRGDVNEDLFVECADGDKEFYECEMSCEETREGFFECAPLLPARKLIRGDLFLLTMKTEGEEYELQVEVSEAQDLLVPESESEPIRIREDYRILRIFSLTEEPNPFLWSLLQRKVAGGPWLPLRSGDFLALGAGDEGFQIAVEVPEGVQMDGPPSATWSSLVKWNGDLFLNWDARSGDFVEEFQIFDPRLRDQSSGEVIEGEGEPSTFRYTVSAEDVPDQKTEEFRYAQAIRELLFAPEIATKEPDLQVDGDEEDLVEATVAAESINGSVQSFSGEVRSLAFRLSDGPEGTRSRLLYFDPNDIQLLGAFTATLVYVSDWNEDGIVDEWNEETGIPNTLDAVALDVQGNWTYTTVPVEFFPATSTDGNPELQILEIFPSVDTNQEALLPFGEELRVRTRAADDRGQPELSGWQCNCVAEEPLINEDKCPCELVGIGELNAGGEFPQNPWEWVVVEPVSETQKSIGVLRATEKVDEGDDKREAKFSGIEVSLEPEAEEEAYKMKVSLQEILGPNVILSGLQNGDIVDPNGLVVQATIFANVSEVNQIKALWNREPRGTPTYDNETGVFLWDLQEYTVREGDRICVGATSVTGHANLYLLDFADTVDGLLLGLTSTTDLLECAQIP
jgi:hypothetical protein